MYSFVPFAGVLKQAAPKLEPRHLRRQGDQSAGTREIHIRMLELQLEAS